MAIAALEWLLVAALGALIGVGELVARYRDAPGSALSQCPALLYIALNAVAAAVALALIRTLGLNIGVPATGTDSLHWGQILAAGFGAMALLRSSVFVVRVGDQDVPVGPSSFLQIILGAADRAVDRLRAESRATAVSRIMAGVSFAKANVALPTHCLALMQNLPPEDQKQLAEELNALRAAQMPDSVKVLDLGLALMNAVGEAVLTSAVKSLGAEIRD